jgi:hypothetical protein
VRLLNKKNKRRGCLVSALAIITTVVLTTTLTLFKLTSNSVYADGELTPADSLLLKVIKERIKECISRDILTKADVSSNDNISKSKIFNDKFTDSNRSGIYDILYKYGAGNTANGPKLNCNQLFGFDSSINGGGSFKPYETLGGNAKPPVDNRAATPEMKNKFLEALGYVPENGSQQNKFYCGRLVYYVAADANSQGGGEKRTPSICINVDESGNVVPSSGDKISLNDLAPSSGGDSDIITLDYQDSPFAFQVKIKTPGILQGCTTYSETVLTGSPLNSFINRPASQVFDELINNAASKGNSFPGNAHSHGNQVVPGETGRPINQPCNGSTVAEAFKSNSVTFRRAEEDSARTSEGGNAEDGRRQKYKYTGTPDYDKLINYYVPNYTLNASNSAITDLEKAYYWYYLLKDVFEGISVDLSLETPCSDSASAAGQNYLKYHNVHIDNPAQAVDKFCTLDSNTLNHKSDQAIVPGFDNGLVPSISSTNALRDMNVNDVLTALNGLNLVSLCEQDGNFPLCKADPVTCAKDPDNAGCKDIANNATDSGEDEKAGEQAACMQNAGALGWVICPLMYGTRDAANGLFQYAVSPLLRVHESVLTGLSSSSNSPMYQAWSFFRNVANIMFVIAMLFVIFSQITGFGIDNYGIKKILPKLIVTAIIVNFSYIICGIFVDLSNIVGEGIKNILESVAGSTTTATEKLGDNVVGAINALVGALATTGVVTGGLTIAGAALSSAVVSGSLLTVIFPILAFVGAALMAGFFAMLMLGLRQALIIIMIVISPVAFVLYAIPNTNGLFKKWFQLFKTLLMLFPVFCFMVGGGFLVSNIIIKGSKDFFMTIIGGLISIAPYFAVPSMTKNAMKGFDGAVAGLGALQQKANNAGTSINKKITNSDTMKDSMQNAQIGKMQRYVDKYKGTDVSKLQPWQKRRLSNAVGFLNKDGRKNAAIGAAMKEYEYNADPRNAANINRSAMRSLNDAIQNDMMGEFKSDNMSVDDALRALNHAQEYEYDKGTAEDNRANDNRVGALTSYLASTKEGQKAFDKYVKGKYVDGTGHVLQPGKSSDRAMAVIQQTMQDKHSDLRDKYHTTFEHLDTKRATQDIESMMGPTQDANRLSSGMPETRRKVARELDFDDYSKMGKQDFEQFYNTNKGSNGAPDTYSAGYAAGTPEYNHLNELANSRIKQLKSDPSLISTLSDQEKRFISAYSTGNVDVNTISSVLYMKDASGTVTGTIEQA